MGAGLESALQVRSEGAGPDVLLIHGGAGPETTWAGVEGLAARWAMRYVYRRGYGQSPAPVGGRQDWEVDGVGIVPLLGERTHLVAHSYGCHGVLHAGVAAPARVASLTLIEPPVYFLNPGDPEIERFAVIGDEVLTEGEHADPAHLREFLGVAGVPVDDGPLPDAVLAGVRRAHGGRLPSESRPDLEAIRNAGIPVLVASGHHMPGMERICDALAAALDGERLRAPGAGHFVPAAPGFAPSFERFLDRAVARAL